MPAGASTPGSLGCGSLFGPLEALLDLANAGEILVELLAILGRQTAFHLPGVFHHEVEDGTLLGTTAPQVGRPLAR